MSLYYNLKMDGLQSYLFALMVSFLIAMSDAAVTKRDLCNFAAIREQRNFIRVPKNQTLPNVESWKRKKECDTDQNHHDQNKRSICPWDCYENYDARRHPQIIEEKICKNGPHAGLPNTCQGMDSDVLHCASITTNVQVWDFIQRCTHFDIYSNRTLQVRTGCSCVNAG